MNEQKHWYIAIVAPNTEFATAGKLGLEYEVYVPSQKVVSVWKDGRRKLRERILLPGKLLIHCTEQERHKTLQYSFVKRYMVDIASSPNEFGRRSVAIVPDDQVQRLKFVLGQQEFKVEIDNVDLKAGEKVRVIRGPLAGLEGVVSDRTSQLQRIYIEIDHLGTAIIEIGFEDIERI